MCKDDCDKYRKKKQMDNYNKICNHFTGDKENSIQISECREHCSYYDSMKFIEEDI